MLGISEAVVRHDMSGADKTMICPRCLKAKRLGKVDVTLEIRPDPDCTVKTVFPNLAIQEVEINPRGAMVTFPGGIYNAPAVWEHSDRLLSIRCSDCKVEMVEIDTVVAPLVHALLACHMPILRAIGDIRYTHGETGSIIETMFPIPNFFLNAMTAMLLPAEGEAIGHVVQLVAPNALHFDCSPNRTNDYAIMMAGSLLAKDNPYRNALIIWSNHIGAHIRTWSDAAERYAAYCFANRTVDEQLNSQLKDYLEYLTGLRIARYPQDDRELFNAAMQAVVNDWRTREPDRTAEPAPMEALQYIKTSGAHINPPEDESAETPEE